MRAKIHWLLDGSLACGAKGGDAASSTDPSKVTCKNCQSTVSYREACPQYATKRAGRPISGKGHNFYCAALDAEDYKYFRSICSRAAWIRDALSRQIAKERRR